MKHYLALLLGIFAAATAPFFIKLSVPVGPASLASARCLISAIILAPFFFRAIRHRGRRFERDDLIAALPGGALFAIHQATWSLGVRETTAVLSTLIINLNTVLMPFLIYLVLRERITLGEMIGSATSLAGVAWLAMSKDASGVTTARGVAVCIVSITFCAAYFTMGRRFGRGRSLVVYVVPLYAIAGALSLAYAIAAREPMPPASLRLATIVFFAALVPTVVGHTAMNYAMIHLPSQVVAMSNPAQVALIAIAAVPLLGERPSPGLLAPALLVVAGMGIVIQFAPRRVQKELDRATAESPGT